jgi:GPH family glycoside/pentoside/hexuronide:cation symporter
MCILNLFTGIFAGVYETGLNMNGYDPMADMAQPQGVVNWLYFIKYMVPAVEYAIIILILLFMNLEKKLPDMQKEIRERYIAAAEARGEVWVSPEEQEEAEKAENERLAEEARIADLKAKCERRGLDFDTENQKYLDKKNKKRK